MQGQTKLWCLCCGITKKKDWTKEKKKPQEDLRFFYCVISMKTEPPIKTLIFWTPLNINNWIPILFCNPPCTRANKKDYMFDWKMCLCIIWLINRWLRSKTIWQGHVILHDENLKAVSLIRTIRSMIWKVLKRPNRPPWLLI